MWMRFTERARQVILFGLEEAQSRGAAQVDTEHFLLGIVRTAEGVAAKVLGRMNVSNSHVRAEIENQLPPSAVSSPPIAEPKLTSRAKRVLELAADEARSMGHNYVGTEHLLIGLVREENGVGAKVLRNLGLTLENVRREVSDI